MEIVYEIYTPRNLMQKLIPKNTFWSFKTPSGASPPRFRVLDLQGSCFKLKDHYCGPLYYLSTSECSQHLFLFRHKLPPFQQVCFLLYYSSIRVGFHYIYVFSTTVLLVSHSILNIIQINQSLATSIIQQHLHINFPLPKCLNQFLSIYLIPRHLN